MRGGRAASTVLVLLLCMAPWARMPSPSSLRANPNGEAEVRRLIEGATPTEEAGLRLLLAEFRLKQGDGRKALEHLQVVTVLAPGTAAAARAGLLRAWAGLRGQQAVRADALVDLVRLSILATDTDLRRDARASLHRFAAGGALTPVELLAAGAILPSSDTLLHILGEAFQAALGRTGSLPPTLLILPADTGRIELARRLREGAVLALEDAGRAYFEIVEDNDPSVFLPRLRAALAMVRPGLVIGPMTSAASAAAAALLSGPDAPVHVLPTATASGIAALGPRTIQLNLGLEAQGEAMGRYAASCLGLTEVAMIHAAGPYGDGLGAGFRRAFEALGGVVWWTRRVEAQRGEFGAEMESLRREHSQRLARRGIRDTTQFLPAIYAPWDSPAPVVTLATQANAQRLRPLWLGSSGWHAPGLAGPGPGPLDGAFVITDFEADPSRPAWSAFAARYQARWGRQPDRLAALGADAVLLGLDPSRILAGGAVDGAQGMIRLDPDTREQRHATFLRVDRGLFRRTDNNCLEQP